MNAISHELFNNNPQVADSRDDGTVIQTRKSFF
jgi:hypothetical protein